MSVNEFDTEYLEVGDVFEGSPIEQGYFISAVLGAGGEVKLNGNKVIIVSIPKKEVSKAKAPDSAKVADEPKPEAPKVETKKVEPEVATAPALKPVTKPKTASAQEKTKE